MRTRSALCLALAIGSAPALSGCSQPSVAEDDAPVHEDDAPVREGDASGACEYELVAGNCAEGAISLDDARVEAVDPRTLDGAATPCRAPVLVRVTNVRDGDTVDVIGVSDPSFFGGVRLVGVDSPESARGPMAAECYAAEASAFTDQLDGRLVWLTFDRECQDRYDRWLSFAWVGPGEGDLWQHQLLRRGLATTLTIAPNGSLAAEFAADSSAAMAQRLGLHGACAGR